MREEFWVADMHEDNVMAQSLQCHVELRKGDRERCFPYPSYYITNAHTHTSTLSLSVQLYMFSRP